MEKEIEPKLRRIGEYLDIGSKRFVIPEYQRAYSWGTEQCEMLLFSDVSNLGNGGAALPVMNISWKRYRRLLRWRPITVN